MSDSNDDLNDKKPSGEMPEVRVRKSSSISGLMQSKRKITKPSMQQLTEEAKPQAELPSWAENWKKKLGEYDLGDTSARMTELLGTEPNSAARQALYQSAKGKDVIGSDTNKETHSARVEFIEYIGKRFAELSAQKDFKDKPTTMEELIGKKGIELYQAACAEENNTRAFRDAVFISSSQTFDGPKWDQRLMIWVGGPSASGKSFGTEGLINQLNAANGADPNSNEKNHVVSIDGGKEREMSQMRQMVLQLGLAQGFSGVEDLEKYSKDIKAKSFVQEAVMADGKLNMVTPATFTDPGGKHEKIMEELAKDPNTKQIFAQVRGVPSNDNLDGLDQFKQTTKKMGKRRAFRLELPPVDPTKPEPTAENLVKPNNRKIGVESKDYDPNIFDLGFKQSNAMREKFEKICQKKGRPVNYFEITNDLIFIKKDSSNNWVPCTAEDDFNTPGIKMTNVRAFAAFNQYKAEIPNLDIKDFMSQVYVQYQPDKQQWAEIKVEKDQKPPEGAISLTKAGWEIAKLIKAHESPALDKLWKLKLADECGAKSIIHEGGHPDRPENQKDKNEEKITQVGAALRSLGVPLPERSRTVSNLSATATGNDGILTRATGTKGLATKRRNDSTVVSPNTANTVETHVQPVQPVASTPVEQKTQQSLMADLSAVLEKSNEKTFVKPVKRDIEKNTSGVRFAQSRDKANTPIVPPILSNAAEILKAVPTQAGIDALNSNNAIPPVLPLGLNRNMERSKPPSQSQNPVAVQQSQQSQLRAPVLPTLPSVPQASENKANNLGEEALNATIAKAVLQSGNMSRSKRSAVNFSQPGVIDALQKEEIKPTSNTPISGAHRTRINK